MAQISLDAALQKIKNYPAAQPGATDAVDTAEAVMKSKVLSIPAAILSAVCIAAAIVAGAYTGLCAYVANSDAIWPGVTVLGQDLSGMTVAEASSRLDAVLSSLSANLYLYDQAGQPGDRTGEADYSIPLRDLGLTLDGHTIAQDAHDVNVKDPPFFSLGWQYLTGEGVSEYRATLDLDPALKEARSQEAAEALSIPVTDSSYQFDGHTITAVLPIDGRTVRAEDIRKKLDGIVNDRSTLSMDIPYTVDTVPAVTAQEIHDAVYRETKNAYYDKRAGAVAAGQHGIDFDMAALQADLDAAGQGETVQMDVTVTAPTVTSDQMRAVLFRDLLGEASTPLTGGSARIGNVKLSAAAINNAILNSGEVFSYNATTGQRTEAKGYQAAPAYVNGLTVDEIGGGVCQPSSTLYLACLRANLQITERYAHRYIPTYIEPGMDATVSWGGPDYKFTNNTLYPIKVTTAIEDGRIYVRLYGTNVKGTYAKMTNELLSTTPYTTRYEPDPTLANGTVKVTPYTGYKYKTYRNIYDANGNLISSTFEDTSDYKFRDKIIVKNG